MAPKRSVKSDSADRPGKNDATGKPWKLRQKEKQTKEEDVIQIFEGKPALETINLPSTSPDSGYLRVIAEGDAEFVVPSEVVESFECVDVILHRDAVYLEKVENVIRFPDIRPEIMESVLRFVFMEHLNTKKAEKYWGSDPPRVVFQFEVEPGLVMEIIHAAHFLGTKNLLVVAATMVAHCLKDVPDVSSMPGDLAWCVAEQFSPLDLFEAEERADFLSLNLDTEKLWRKHCVNLFFSDPITPVSPFMSYPSYRDWDIVENPPPTSWKSLYISHLLQQLADRQDGGANDAFFKEARYRGKHAHKHTIRPMFWDWVMCAQGAWPLSLYVAQFPRLLSLSLAKIPLYKSSTDGTIPCLSIGEILRSLPLLQYLDLSETGFTAEAAVSLSKSLQLHKSLQVLRLAYNGMKTKAFSKIASTLEDVRTLKVLDVRENGIASVADDSVVTAINLSGLEEFLFSGNCRESSEIESREFCRQELYPGMSQVGTSGHRPIETFELSYCTLFVSIFSRVPTCLLNLELSDCHLMDSHMRTLTQALTGHTSIQKLDLGDNAISCSGAIAIYCWLQTNKSLQELSLANNKISDASAPALAAMLHEHPFIQKISLNANYDFGEQSLQEVITAAIAHSTQMERQFCLDLRNTDMSHTARARLLRHRPQLGPYFQLLI